MKKATSIVVIIVLLVCLSINPAFCFDWEDDLTLYPNVYKIVENVRNITYQGLGMLNVTVRYKSSNNIERFALYRVYGNGVTFIRITNGIITTSESTISLRNSESLILNLETKGASNITSGQTASVEIEVIEEEIATTQGVYVVPTTPSKLFDLKILTLPLVLNWSRAQSKFSVSFSIENKGVQSMDVLLQYGINSITATVHNMTDIVFTGSQTVLVYAKQQKTIFLTLDTPTKSGVYEFYVKTASPEMAMASQTFSVIGAHYELDLSEMFLIFVVGAVTITLLLVYRKKGRGR
jgi:hypothetical protein